MRIFLKKINTFILDVLFPIKCLSCKKEGEWFCQNCLGKMKIQTEDFCGICEKKISPDGRTCFACKKKTSLDAFLSACSYQQTEISKAVHLFKYRFIADLHLPLADLLISKMQKNDLPLPDIIIPIPLHSRRLRWRGFNQAELLANHFAKNLLPATELKTDSNILLRNRYTKPQMEIRDYHSRKTNISNAFTVSSEVSVKNKTILLIDDIATTGSTIFECAKILKEAGAKEVFALVIARQETKS